jgi:hypothetical protein
MTITIQNLNAKPAKHVGVLYDGTNGKEILAFAKDQAEYNKGRNGGGWVRLELAYDDENASALIILKKGEWLIFDRASGFFVETVKDVDLKVLYTKVK